RELMSPAAAISKYRLAVLSRAERMEASISEAVRQASCAWAGRLREMKAASAKKTRQGSASQRSVVVLIIVTSLRRTAMSYDAKTGYSDASNRLSGVQLAVTAVTSCNSARIKATGGPRTSGRHCRTF